LFSISRNYSNIFGHFIVDLQKNLYFTCLVLNTLLYILMQKFETADDELNMLVCGLGLQFAGPAAMLALVFLSPNHQYTNPLFAFVSPLCTLGMLVTWFYAVAPGPKTARVSAPRQLAPVRVRRQQPA